MTCSELDKHTLLQETLGGIITRIEDRLFLLPGDCPVPQEWAFELSAILARVYDWNVVVKRDVLDYDLIAYVPEPGALWDAGAMEPFEPMRNTTFPPNMLIISPTSIGLRARAALGAMKDPVNAVQEKVKVFVEPQGRVGAAALGQTVALVPPPSDSSARRTPQRSGAIIRSPSPRSGPIDVSHPSTPIPSAANPNPKVVPSSSNSASTLVRSATLSQPPALTSNRASPSVKHSTRAESDRDAESAPESYATWKANSDARKRTRSMSTSNSPVDTRPPGTPFAEMRGRQGSLKAGVDVPVETCSLPAGRSFLDIDAGPEDAGPPPLPPKPAAAKHGGAQGAASSVGQW